MGANVEDSAERYRIPDWVPVVVAIAALIFLAWVYYPHAPTWLVDHLPGHTSASHSGTRS